MTHFNALTLERSIQNQIEPVFRKTEIEDLSPGDTLIRVAYSGVNYKDALASQEASGVVRQYPIIPGIDFSGIIVETTHPSLVVGQKVLATGYGLGVSHSGGFSEFARVPSEWLIPLPNGMSLKDAMILGTAGLTAALSIDALEKQGMNEHKEARILITGASGGVGSLAIGMLRRLGYENLTALSRKKEASATYFKELGVKEVLTAEDITPDKIRPLMPQRFDFVIDTVGGHQLDAIIPQITYNGSISLCGNVGGITFSTTVLPYILRGITIIGIDSVNISKAKRDYIWPRIALEMLPSQLEQFAKASISLPDLPTAFTKLLAGEMTGRHLVVINDGL